MSKDFTSKELRSTAVLIHLFYMHAVRKHGESDGLKAFVSMMLDEEISTQERFENAAIRKIEELTRVQNEINGE
tara:strand:- start:14674 stop:14895 length:222 start_codon:yes stop_codon:yes gene_type:complete